jgi:hypothetical protein
MLWISLQGHKIEVKSSADCQSWRQEKLSTIRFGSRVESGDREVRRRSYTSHNLFSKIELPKVVFKALPRIVPLCRIFTYKELVMIPVFPSFKATAVKDDVPGRMMILDTV